MTMMHLAVLPDWNSLDSVRRAHGDLEAAGLVFFALLVAMEALAHNSKDEHRKHLFDSIGIWFFAVAIFCEIGGYWYGQRNDELSQQVIVSLDAKASDASQKAAKAVTDSGEAETKSDGAVTKAGIAEKAAGNAVKTVGTIKGEVDSAKTTADLAKGEVDGAKRDADAVSKEVNNARAELRVVETFVSARHVVDIKPFDRLKPFQKRKVSLLSISGDEEAREFCLALAEKLKVPLFWKSSPPDTDNVIEWPIAGCGAMMGGNAVGVSVSGSDSKFTQVLANVIRDATGVPVNTFTDPSQTSPGDTVRITVGAKTPGFFHTPTP